MLIEFKKICSSDLAELANFLASEEWEFFVHQYSDAHECQSKIKDKFFMEDKESFFIKLQESSGPVGLIEIFDISSEPWFSLRIKCSHRGKGMGKKALDFLTSYVFEKFPDIYRIEASTREDNFPMQKVFKNSLWVKEGHLREALKTKDGRRLAAFHYGIIRKDWETKTKTSFVWKD